MLVAGDKRFWKNKMEPGGASEAEEGSPRVEKEASLMRLGSCLMHA